MWKICSDSEYQKNIFVQFKAFKDIQKLYNSGGGVATPYTENTAKLKVEFKCDEFDFVGKLKASMEVHIGKHHCEKYECGLCDSEIGSQEKLETHLKTCEAYECDHHSGCDRRYKTLSDLKKHFTEKHKKDMVYFNHLKIDRNDCNEVSVKNYDNV